MESQLELEGERVKLVDKLRQALPDLMTREAAVVDGVYKDGALSHKVKRLIALAIALRAGCTNCILAQTISVEVVMSGTTGVAESLRVIKLLDELGKL